jgi:hypothetical protein
MLAEQFAIHDGDGVGAHLSPENGRPRIMLAIDLGLLHESKHFLRTYHETVLRFVVINDVFGQTPQELTESRSRIVGIVK